ncbi:cytochrome P450 monooxygenase pc-3 [Ramaria rubella]|nr:cytochrome P450 monooxygenase pc-3 [Ramaria rubella]
MQIIYLIALLVSSLLVLTTPHWTAVIAAIVCVYPIIRSWATNEDKKNGSSIPKIRGRLPGNIDILWKLVYNESKEYCGNTLRIWAEIYGPTYDMNILWGHQVISDPANVKHILANDFESFAKGTKFREMFDSFLGSGIFTSDGDTWKCHRAMARPFFSVERVTDFDCFAKHTSKALDVISEHANQGKPLDIQARFSRFTLDCGADFLFGYAAETLTGDMRQYPSRHAYSSFSEAFDCMSKIVTRRVRIGSNWRIFDLGRDPTKKHMKRIHSFVEPIIQNAFLSRGAEIRLQERSFLEYLVKSNSDVKLVRDELLNLLLAARDTTASLLTFTTYILAYHQDVCSKLRVEIEHTIGEREFPTIVDIRGMKYLRAVINEVLRLFPPVPFNIRRCVRPSMLPSPLSNLGPFLITPGISVTYSPLLTQRRPDIWGPSACLFDPQRWLHDGAKTHLINSFAFLPFNGGPRMCLGQQFAYHECSYFVIRLLQVFKTLDLAPDAQPPESRPPAAWASFTSTSSERQNVEKCWPAASLTLHSKARPTVRIEGCKF